jgi:uncharacterized repeat protein (TIGR04076 family)
MRQGIGVRKRLICPWYWEGTERPSFCVVLGVLSENCAEGDEFVVEHIGVRAEGFFCDWAWDDIHKVLLAMQQGGDFSPWMKDEKTFIACCTDGVQPVIFKLERIE